MPVSQPAKARRSDQRPPAKPCSRPAARSTFGLASYGAFPLMIFDVERQTEATVGDPLFFKTYYIVTCCTADVSFVKDPLCFQLY